MLNDGGGDKLEAHFSECLHDKLAGGRARQLVPLPS